MRLTQPIITIVSLYCFMLFIASCSKADLLTPSSSSASTSLAAKKADDTQVDDNGGLTSSTNSSSSAGTTTIATVAINTGLLTGVWHVTYYFDKSVKTSKFTGYNFTFSPAGTIVATNGTTTHNGTWTTNASLTKFNMVFSTAKPFTELTDDWKVISQTTAKLELVHVSGGNGGTDYITFEQ